MATRKRVAESLESDVDLAKVQGTCQESSASSSNRQRSAVTNSASKRRCLGGTPSNSRHLSVSDGTPANISDSITQLETVLGGDAFKASSSSAQFQEPISTCTSKRLAARRDRLMNTPQFTARLSLFTSIVRDQGCATIPSISKAIADLEHTVNGPDR